MSDLLAKAQKALGVEDKPVLSHKIYDDEIVLVVDLGIKGCPKYRVALSDLPKDEPKPEPEPEETKPARRSTRRRSTK